MANDSADYRVYWAAERTLLAWIRTGISIMAFGFVVARFGLFLRLLQAQTGRYVTHGLSPYIGTALVAFGAVAIGAGALQYQKFHSRRGLAESPSPHSHRLPLALAWILTATGAALVAVLLV